MQFLASQRKRVMTNKQTFELSNTMYISYDIINCKIYTVNENTTKI